MGRVLTACSSRYAKPWTRMRLTGSMSLGLPSIPHRGSMQYLLAGGLGVSSAVLGHGEGLGVVVPGLDLLAGCRLPEAGRICGRRGGSSDPSGSRTSVRHSWSKTIL